MKKLQKFYQNKWASALILAVVLHLIIIGLMWLNWHTPKKHDQKPISTTKKITQSEQPTANPDQPEALVTLTETTTITKQTALPAENQTDQTVYPNTLSITQADQNPAQPSQDNQNLPANPQNPSTQNQSSSSDTVQNNANQTATQTTNQNQTLPPNNAPKDPHTKEKADTKENGKNNIKTPNPTQSNSPLPPQTTRKIPANDTPAQPQYDYVGTAPTPTIDEHPNDHLLLDIDLPKSAPRSQNKEYQDLKSEAQKMHDVLASEIEKIKQLNQEKIDKARQELGELPPTHANPPNNPKSQNPNDTAAKTQQPNKPAQEPISQTEPTDQQIN